MEFTYERFPLSINLWIHEEDNKFLGKNLHPGLEYGLFISPYNVQEPDVYYFHIAIEKVIENEENGIVFHAQTESKFRIILLQNQIPEVKLYFRFICEATEDFALEFHKRTRETTLLHHRIPIPLIADFRKDIQACIDRWDTSTRFTVIN